jgi:hypothetical protein
MSNVNFMPHSNKTVNFVMLPLLTVFVAVFALVQSSHHGNLAFVYYIPHCTDSAR